MLICRKMPAFSSVTELIHVVKRAQNHQYNRTEGNGLNTQDLSPGPFQHVVFHSNQDTFPIGYISSYFMTSAVINFYNTLCK